MTVAAQPRLFDMGGLWHQVRRCDPRARVLADRHYSRQTPGAAEFMVSGRTLASYERILSHEGRK